jgi:predicted ATPase/DNA-binding SARP family transcriptional activator
MLEVRLIGKFEIKYDGKPVIISSRAAQSIFAYLILNAGTSYRREKLAGMFWPDATEETARAYLRHELWSIRKAFPPQSKVEYLIANDINISFDAFTEYWLDVTVLTNVREAASIEELINALSVFHGELLPGFYDDWVIQEREHLQAVYEKKIARLLELLEKEKCWSEILEWAEHWISFGQAPEAAFRYLMIAYNALGDRSKVTSTYERCVQALRDLDIEPSEQTRALAFKRTPKLNIPIPLTSFIGREVELKEVADLFSKSRLVTLTGSGGVGKTRLAIQVVAEVLNMFPDGVWFLDLAPLSDPTLVPNTLAAMLGLRESRELPITDLLINYFRSRTALVIFDNCEHLIGPCAQLINSLLTSCEHLSILATSREALRVSGEIPFRVPSLEIPKSDIEFAIDEISSLESVKLFAERAAVASPGFAIGPQILLVIAQICQRLDGIPLAIELAAARTNMLTVEQISKRLDDRFNLLTGGSRTDLPRHQTLRATIEWSYDLLSEKERLLFRCLAVFVGGWTLEAAEEVCSGKDIEVGEVLDLLFQLVNKSLVLVESRESLVRYRRLETIRQYAREKLKDSDEEENIRDRHLKYFLQLSEQAETALRGPTQIEWMSRLNDERDNIRAALEYAAKNNDVEAGLYLSGRLGRFWEGFDLKEGTRWLDEFLGRSESTTMHQARAKALCVKGGFLGFMQQFDEAISAAQECLALYRICGDHEGEVDGLLLLGSNLDVTKNLELTQQALALARSRGDVWRQAKALDSLGWNYAGDERFAYWEEAITLFQQSGDWRSLAVTLSVFGNFVMLHGNLEVAQKRLDEAGRLNDQLKDKIVEADLLYAYGRMAMIRGEYNQARVYLEEELKVVEELGALMGSLWCRAHLGYLALHEGNLTEARSIFAETTHNFQKDQNVIGVVFSLEGMARLYIIVSKSKIAARLIGWTDEARKKIGDTRPLLEQADVDKIIAACYAKMGEVAFSKAYDEGKKMTLDEAVALALED